MIMKRFFLLFVFLLLAGCTTPMAAPLETEVPEVTVPAAVAISPNVEPTKDPWAVDPASIAEYEAIQQGYRNLTDETLAEMQSMIQQGYAPGIAETTFDASYTQWGMQVVRMAYELGWSMQSYECTGPGEFYGYVEEGKCFNQFTGVDGMDQENGIYVVLLRGYWEDQNGVGTYLRFGILRTPNPLYAGNAQELRELLGYPRKYNAANVTRAFEDVLAYWPVSREETSQISGVPLLEESLGIPGYSAGKP